MTPADLLAWAHRETNTADQPVTPATALLAHYCAILEMGFGAAYLQTVLRVNVMEKAELPKLKLDTAVIHDPTAREGSH